MKSQDGDTYFKGLDMTRDPAVLAAGLYSVGEHVECENGTIATRPGNLCVPWGDYWTFSRTYEKRPIQSHGTIIDAIRFANPTDGQERVLFITASGGFLLQPGSPCVQIAFPTGLVAPSSGMLVQVFNQVYFLNKNYTLSWSGDTQDDWVYAPSADGYTSVNELNSEIGCYYKNRLFITTDENTVWASDILEPAAFSINNEFYVNQGDADSIVALVPYTNDRVVVFKENSIYSLDNLTGDLSGAEINLVASEMGLSAKRCVEVVGQSVFWLSRRGIMRAVLAYDQRLTPDVVPISEPIEPVIRRINWAHADKAWSCVVGDRIYFAVPVDDDTQNNCVLVYSLKTGAWESTDIYADFTENKYGTDVQSNLTYTDNFGPQALVRMTFAGRDVVIAFTHLGATYLHRYNHGKQDMHIEPQATLAAFEAGWDNVVGVDVSGVRPFIQNAQAIDSEIQTRGYLAGDLSTKRGVHFDYASSTFDPNFSVYAVTAGPNETTAFKEDVTRSSTQRLDYQNSGTSTRPEVHTEAYLADYSIDIQDRESTGSGSFYFGDGSTYEDVYVPREQEFNERFRLNKRVRAPRLRVTNTQGIFRLKSVTANEYMRNKKNRREV